MSTLFEGFADAPPLPGWITRDFPFRRRVAHVAGQRIHFVDEGDGSPVFLMHGNPTWAYLWRHVIRRLLPQGVRVIAPDLMGLGLSSKPRALEAHRLEAHVGLMAALVEALDLREMTVVGQDWGGPISAGMAMRHADRVRGLVYANTTVVKPPDEIGTTSFHRLARMPVVSDVLFRGLGFPLWILHRTQGDPQSISWRAMGAYAWPLRRLRDRAAPLALARMVPSSRDHPSVPLIEAIGAWVEHFDGPVRLVWGTRDPILGRTLHRQRRRLPRAPVTETEAGHFLQEEVPGVLAENILAVARTEAA